LVSAEKNLIAEMTAAMRQERVKAAMKRVKNQASAFANAIAVPRYLPQT